MNNMIKMDIESYFDMLCKVYHPMLKNDMDFSFIKPFLIWGQPGIGKSSIVYQFKDYIETNFHKEVNVLDLRLYLYAEVDLKGVPYADEDKKHTIWLGPKMFDLDPSPNKVHIIFLDEFLSAKQSVRNVALQIALDRKIDTIELPKNTIIIAASNREQDGCFVSPLSLALADRFSHVDICVKEEAWVNYAFSHKIDPRIIAYIRFNPNALCENLEADRYVFSTPRTWEKLSHVIKHYENIEDVKDIVYCIVGKIQGMAFVHYCHQCANLSTMQDVMLGKGKVPTSHDGLYMMATQIVYTLLNKDVQPTQLNHIMRYLGRFPEDYILNVLINIKDLAQDNIELYSLPSYQQLITKVGRYI